MIQLKKIKSTSTTTTTKDTSTSMRRPHKTNKIFFCLTTETIQQVMSYLTMPERFLFLSTNKKIYQEEPFAIKYTSFCTKCHHCLSKNQYLCHKKEYHQHQRSTSFWKKLFTTSSLIELRLASSFHLSSSSFSSSLEYCFTTGNRNTSCFSSLVQLKVLHLNKCNQIDPKILFQIATFCTNLKELRLVEMYHLTVKTSTIITKFSTNEGNGGEMNILKKFFENNQKTLENIDLTGNHTLVGKNLKGLFFVSSILQELSLKGCFNIENLTIIEIFQQCKQIKCLDLNSCHQINDQVIFFLATNLLFLKELNLGSCLKITDMAIKSLCQYLPLLEKLNCSQNTRLTDLAIDQIVSSLFFLKELRVWGCTKLTWTSIYALSIGLPCLTLIDIRSRDKIEIMIGGQKALNFFLYRSSTMKSTSLCSYKWEQAEQLGVFKRTIPCSVVPAVWS